MTRVLHIAKDLAPNSGITTYLRTVLEAQAERGDTEVHLMSGSGAVPEGFSFLTVPHQNLSLDSGWEGVPSLAATVVTIRRYCRRYGIGVIHTHHRMPELASVAAAWRSGVRTVTTVHSLVDGMHAVSFRSDHIIAVSEVVRRRIVRRFGRREGTVLRLYNPMASEPQPPPGDASRLRSELGIPATHRILLFVGRNDAMKGGPFLAEWFRSNAVQRSGITLLMVGDASRTGPHHETLPNGDQLRILPPRHDMASFYQVSDVVILPSRRDSFPYVMLEAGRAERPFVGSDVDGIAEFVRHGESGLLFPVGDALRMSECVRAMLDDPKGAKRMAASLHAAVSSLPTPEEHATLLSAIYDGIEPIRNGHAR